MSGGLLCFINKWSKKKCIYSFLAFIIFFETGCQYMTEAKDKMVEDGNLPNLLAAYDLNEPIQT